MQKLTKGPIPRVLARYGAAWTRNYIAASTPAALRRAEKWRHPEIKAALRFETAKRCAYCESFVEDVTYLHVEHIIPKSVAKELAHEWTNLVAACPKCNGEKSSYHSIHAPLVDPLRDDPDEHLAFLGDMVAWQPGSVLGETTVRVLALNRIDLKQGRQRRLEALQALLDRWHDATDQRRLILEEAIRSDTLAGEYPTSARSVLALYQFPF